MFENKLTALNLEVIEKTEEKIALTKWVTRDMRKQFVKMVLKK